MTAVYTIYRRDNCTIICNNCSRCHLKNETIRKIIRIKTWNELHFKCSVTRLIAKPSLWQNSTYSDHLESIRWFIQHNFFFLYRYGTNQPNAIIHNHFFLYINVLHSINNRRRDNHLYITIEVTLWLSIK